MLSVVYEIPPYISSFVSQNLIGLAMALAIMLGADIGTAMMALVFSLDLSWLSPLAIFFGVVLFLSRRNTRAGQIGRVSIGLGLIILALQMAMTATAPITQAQGVRVIFSTLSGDPLLDMLIGAVFTMLSFSSLAVILLAATFAAAHVVSVPVAMCLVLGSGRRATGGAWPSATSSSRRWAASSSDWHCRG